jgi:hypothetical protein
MPADEVLVMNAKMGAWLATVPSYFREDVPLDNPPEWLLLARYRILWRVRNFRIVLLCPELLRWAGARARGISTSETDTKSRQLCQDICLGYAHQTILSVTEYFSLNIFSPVCDWYATYFIFQALWIPITAMLADPDNPSASQWFSDVESSKQFLESVSVRDPLARKFLDVVNRFCPSMEAFAGGEISDGGIDEGGGLGQEQLISQIYSQLQGVNGALGANNLW